MTRLEKIEAQLQASPLDPFLHYCRAMELAKLEDIPAARAAFQRVQQLNPQDVAAFFQEGQLLARIGETESARSVLEQGIERARRVGNDHALAEMLGFLDTL
jgi:Flp pilus assembly protein TadD